MRKPKIIKLPIVIGIYCSMFDFRLRQNCLITLYYKIKAVIKKTPAKAGVFFTVISEFTYQRFGFLFPDFGLSLTVTVASFVFSERELTFLTSLLVATASSSLPANQ